MEQENCPKLGMFWNELDTFYTVICSHFSQLVWYQILPSVSVQSLFFPDFGISYINALSFWNFS